jgi:thiamine-monophosphate kinase
MVAVSGEFAAIARLAAASPPAPAGETWIGDDTAVVATPEGALLLAVDTVVSGVHADLSLTGLDDLGWKALVANVSDVAAMGGEAGRAVVSVAGPRGTDLQALYRGLAEAAAAYRCPVVGGDLVSCPTVVVTVAITGSVKGQPVLRGGARPGDSIWVSGPLGGAAAGLRLLKQPETRWRLPPEVVAARIADHARPRAAVAEGTAARLGGATAMIDVSDGFAADLGHVADASGVGVELDGVPVADAATEDEALGGGEDYCLVFTAADIAPVEAAFQGLASPILVGRCVADPAVRRLRGRPLTAVGWQHDWG